MSYYGDDGPQGGYVGTIRAQGAARWRPISKRTLTADAQLVGMGGILKGWCLRETTGAAGAVIEFYDGSNVGGTFLGMAGLGNGVSQPFTFTEGGLTVESGVFAHIVTGSIDVVVYMQFDTGYA